MQLREAQTNYLRWLLAARELSPHTIRAYEGDLSSFEQSLGCRVEVDRIDRDAVISFLQEQKESGLSPASLRRRASALRGFSRWLLSRHLIQSDPWSGASVALGRSRRLPRVLPAQELDRLLTFLRLAAGVDARRAEPASVRKAPHESTTLLAVALMVATGVRVQEAVNLQFSDIDLDARTIRLLGKGRRERQVFLPNQWIVDLTGAYLQTRAALAPPHQRLLFNLRYQPLTTAAMRSRLARAASTAGLQVRVTPHMLRHTAATQLIEAGVDIRFIQRLLGHASLSTTEIYTHISDRALRRVISDADVLGRLAQA